MRAVFVITLPSLTERELFIRVHGFGNDTLPEILAHTDHHGHGIYLEGRVGWVLSDKLPSVWNKHVS